MTASGDFPHSTPPLDPLPDDADGGRPLRKGSRVGLICEAITSAVRDSRLRAGDRLREQDLAEWLGVSRTPVREALKRLEAQGIVHASGDGMTVTRLSPSQVSELYTAWAELEAVAARQAALNARPSDVRLMRSICEQWTADLTPERLGTLNHRLHQAIYTASYNSFLHRALDVIENSVALLGLQTYEDAERRRHAGHEHMVLVEAIARRDPQAAAAAALHHIEEAEKVRLFLLGQPSSSSQLVER
jgi:DNA-binding GntR family transcriptional regulator